MIQSYDDYYYYGLTLIILTGYMIYYRMFSFYRNTEKYDENQIKNRTRRGRCPPSYPNGWYMLCYSKDLQIKQVCEIKLAGRPIVYYRGDDTIPYALGAFCAHMGANLGKGGKVKFSKCIECPFHGWTYDGETGKCVNSELYDTKMAQSFDYCNVEKMEKKENNIFKKITKEQEIKIEKYHLSEMNGFIYIWLHAKEQVPTYWPVKVSLDNMSPRGEGIRYINTHIQEIPENGADIKHFDFLHTKVFEIFHPLLQYKWELTSQIASDPDFNDHRKNLAASSNREMIFDLFLSDQERAKTTNVINIECWVVFLKWKVHILNILGFQTGPATVTLFLKNFFFDAVIFQSIQPIDKFTQKFYHTLHINSYVPYWISAYIIYGEISQVSNDCKIWNHKIFSDKLHYDLKTNADRVLYKWKIWFSQFYEGCSELEKNQEKLQW